MGYEMQPGCVVAYPVQAKRLAIVYAVCFVGVLSFVLWRFVSDINVPHEEYWWLLSHVCMYFVLGLVAHKYWWLCAALGVIWEGIERIGAKLTPHIKYGGMLDLAANTLGFLLGTLARCLAVSRAKTQ